MLFLDAHSRRQLANCDGVRMAGVWVLAIQRILRANVALSRCLSLKRSTRARRTAVSRTVHSSASSRRGTVVHRPRSAAGLGRLLRLQLSPQPKRVLFPLDELLQDVVLVLFARTRRLTQPCWNMIQSTQNLGLSLW